MTYIYIDESGDLGFIKCSKYFVLVCVRINDDETHIRFRKMTYLNKKRTTLTSPELNPEPSSVQCDLLAKG